MDIGNELLDVHAHDGLFRDFVQSDLWPINKLTFDLRGFIVDTKIGKVADDHLHTLFIVLH